ncbi:enoyl-CoA hydratase/isomerase family protein, partial [Sphingobium sp.]|uniref:enoyl-CoA hydratase/isomerase family protein n=1 Tax=Sphingobium sp. TaxID=1912891 RepID=UPI001A35A2DF
MNSITISTDADGIATLMIDVPGQSMNVIGPDFIADLDAAITRIASDDAIKGAVIASGKDSGFMAGMDLKYFGSMLATSDGSRPQPAAIFDQVFVLNQLFRRLETCGKPVACEIEGTCVGGGFEL